MKNRWTINLFVCKDDDNKRMNFSIDLKSYNKSEVKKIVIDKLDLSGKKWTIDISEEIEVVEKERVIFWKTVLKKS
jgi:hypothetical protein